MAKPCLQKRDQRFNVVCTRELGHVGHHEAWNFYGALEEAVERWTDSIPVPKTKVEILTAALQKASLQLVGYETHTHGIPDNDCHVSVKNAFEDARKALREAKEAVA